MRAWLHLGLLVFLGGALAACGFGQSVAEAARQQKEQQSKPHPQGRVYTNEDFPSRAPDTAPPAAAAQEPAGEPNATKSREAAASKQAAATELQNQVRAQKNKIKGLEARIAEIHRELDQFNSMTGVTYDGMTIFSGSSSAYCAGVNALYYPSAADRLYCEQAFILNAELHRREGELVEAQATLEDLQEQLRRMGYRSNFYDPD